MAERARFLGIEVDTVTFCEVKHIIALAVTQGQRWIIANHNLHSLYLFHHDPKMRAFYQRAHVIHVDGMPLVLLGKLFGYSLRPEHRLTCVDWIRPLMAEAAKQGWRVFHLGCKPGVGERAASILRKEFPTLQIDTHHGYFAVEGPENETVLERIRQFKPQILMVGMGMPRQEHWVVDNFDAIEANVILNTGACFDFVAGAVPTPPRWMGRVGLEWLYRLLTEPRRLWKRYLLEPWCIAALVIRYMLLHRDPHTGNQTRGEIATQYRRAYDTAHEKEASTLGRER